jgi:hypothetical protein
MKAINDLKMALIELNEAIGMIDVQLSVVDDPELEVQRDKLVERRREIIKALEGIQ